MSVARLVGADCDYILEHISHFYKLLVEDLDKVLGHAEVLLPWLQYVVHETPDRRSPPRRLVDLVRLASEVSRHDYDGICW